MPDINTDELCARLRTALPSITWSALPNEHADRMQSYQGIGIGVMFTAVGFDVDKLDMPLGDDKTFHINGNRGYIATGVIGSVILKLPGDLAEEVFLAAHAAIGKK
jgi:hypothetical protein